MGPLSLASQETLWEQVGGKDAVLSKLFKGRMPAPLSAAAFDSFIAHGIKTAQGASPL